MKPYVMPAHGEWVLLKIVHVEPVSWKRKIVTGGKIQETEVPSLDVSLVHVSTAYGDKPLPYHLRTSLDDVVCAPRPGVEFKDTASSFLREAVGLAPDAELTPKVLLGKNVMGWVRRTEKPYQDRDGETMRTFANIYPRVLSPEGVTIPVTFRDGRVVQAKVTWDTAHNLLGGPVPGKKVNVISVDLEKQFTAVRVGDEWRDINEV